VSSSFLYLAIVAVWAFVLVPRWLRRQQVQPQVEVDVEVDLEFAADDDAELQGYDEVDDARGYGYADDRQAWSYPGPADADRRAGYSTAPLSRSRVLQARRRLLTMLLLLTAAAVACTVLKLTSWWVCIPPAVMLGSYLLLLREAAVADAEQAHRQAAMAMRVQAAAHQRELAAATEREAQPSAQIIDISARVGDQLYDQYADATVRAVGD
jgi:hypothetical protein